MLQWGWDLSQPFPGFLQVPPLQCSSIHTGSQQPPHSSALCQALTVGWVKPATASPQQQLCVRGDWGDEEGQGYRALLRRGQREKKNLAAAHEPAWDQTTYLSSLVQALISPLESWRAATTAWTAIPETQSSSGKPKLQIHAT